MWRKEWVNGTKHVLRTGPPSAFDVETNEAFAFLSHLHKRLFQTWYFSIIDKLHKITNIGSSNKLSSEQFLKGPSNLFQWKVSMNVKSSLWNIDTLKILFRNLQITFNIHAIVPFQKRLFIEERGSLDY